MTSEANFFPPGLAVRTIRPADNEAVRGIFLRGMREMITPDSPPELRVSLKSYTDSVLMGDLAKPSAYYSKPGRRYWALESQAGEIVATAAVDYIEEELGSAELLRVSVSPEFRRKGVARMLVKTAANWSKQHGYKTLQLQTTNRQPAAIALYESEGFRKRETRDAGLFEIFTFEKTLAQ